MFFLFASKHFTKKPILIKLTYSTFEASTDTGEEKCSDKGK